MVTNYHVCRTLLFIKFSDLISRKVPFHSIWPARSLDNDVISVTGNQLKVFELFGSKKKTDNDLIDGKLLI